MCAARSISLLVSLAWLLAVGPTGLAAQPKEKQPPAKMARPTTVAEVLVLWLSDFLPSPAGRPQASPAPASPAPASPAPLSPTAAAQPAVNPPPPLRPPAETNPATTTLVVPRHVTGGSPQENPPTSALSHYDLEQQIAAVVNKVLHEGPEIHNGTASKSGSPIACVFFFKATLMTVEPLLEHRPELQSSVRRDTTEGMRKLNATDQAFALREVLMGIKRELENPETGKGTTLWDRAGGPRNVKRIVDRFIDASIADPAVNFFRSGKYPSDPKHVADIKRKIFQLASAATGGPDKIYLHKSMKEAHKDMAITDSEFDAMTRHLRIALVSSRVQPEDIKKIMGVVSIVKAEIVRPPGPTPPVPTTLWERLGGEKTVAKIVDEFVDAALKDPKVNFSRNGKFQMSPKQVADLKRHIVTMASAAAKGPLRYEGKTMKEIHHGMSITEDEFEALQSNLRVVLTRNEVAPRDAALILLAFGTTKRDIVSSR